MIFLAEVVKPIIKKIIINVNKLFDRIFFIKNFF